MERRAIRGNASRSKPKGARHVPHVLPPPRSRCPRPRAAAAPRLVDAGPRRCRDPRHGPRVVAQLTVLALKLFPVLVLVTGCASATPPPSSPSASVASAAAPCPAPRMYELVDDSADSEGMRVCVDQAERDRALMDHRIAACGERNESEDPAAPRPRPRRGRTRSSTRSSSSSSSKVHAEEEPMTQAQTFADSTRTSTSTPSHAGRRSGSTKGSRLE